MDTEYLDYQHRRIHNEDTLSTGAGIMDAVIQKWGNSPALRLPASIIKEASFSLE